MDTAKIFKNGSSQAVRLPKACQFNTDAVLAHKIGNVVLLFSPETPGKDWQKASNTLRMITCQIVINRKHISSGTPCNALHARYQYLY